MSTDKPDTSKLVAFFNQPSTDFEKWLEAESENAKRCCEQCHQKFINNDVNLRRAWDAALHSPVVLALVKAATDEITSRVNKHMPRTKTEIALHDALTAYHAATQASKANEEKGGSHVE